MKRIGIGMSISLIVLLMIAGISGVGTIRGESSHSYKASETVGREREAEDEKAEALSREELGRIRLEAQKEYENLKRKKKGLRNENQSSKHASALSEPNEAKGDKQRANPNDSGMLDEEELCKKNGIVMNQSVLKAEVHTCSLKTEKIDFSGAVNLVRDSDKIHKKKKKKDKKIKLKLEDLVMTEEEEAAFWGYTLEEWRELSDKEKYGKCDDSNANTKFGGKSMDLDFE